MSDFIVFIGGWDDENSNLIRIQDFTGDGLSFIPVFSDEDTFRREAAGSGFEKEGVVIDRKLFASMLRGDERLVLNPGSPKPVTLTKEDLLKGPI